MKKILAILGILVLVFSLVGCGYPEEISNPPEVQEVPEVVAITEETEQEVGETLVVPPSPGTSLLGDYGVTAEGLVLTFNPEEYANQTYITPSIVHIGDYYPGATAEFPIYIHNGESEIATFLLTLIAPGTASEGFIPATESDLDWIIVADSSPTVAPGDVEVYYTDEGAVDWPSTKKVWISLQMPEGAGSPGPTWEFWTGVQKTKHGFIAIRLATKWQVTMKD